MNYAQKREYAGDINQLMPYKEYRYSGGHMDGVRAVDLSNGAGLEITLLADRCLDLLQVRVGGKSLNYLSPAGVRHPAYYRPFGEGWLSGFPGGFLATCGLDNIGVPDQIRGKDYPLHGQIGNVPAENLSVQLITEGEVPRIEVQGQMRQAQLFGPNLLLQRKYSITYGSPIIDLWDTIVNQGFHREAYMTLYHFNFGYPLLSEQARLVLENTTVRPRTQHAADHLDSWQTILPPQDQFSEMCYYHNFKEGAQKEFAIQNPAENLSMHIQYTGDSLNQLVQWKMFEKGTYVMGLEPGNATIDGRSDALQNGSIQYLEPGETAKNHFRITCKSL